MSNLKNSVVSISDTDINIINISEISVISIHTMHFFNFDNSNNVELTLKFEDDSNNISPFLKKTIPSLDSYYYPTTLYLSYRNKLKAIASIHNKITCFISYSLLPTY